MTTRIRVLILLFWALVCFAIVTTGGLKYNHYGIHYGSHGWGPPEVAFLFHYLLFGTTAALLLGAAFDLAIGRRLTAGWDRLATLSSRSAWTVTAVLSAAVFGLVTVARYELLGDTAITDDENVYSFMARTFASGRLYLPSMPAPVRPFFDNHFLVNDGKWYGIYFPGHPALLALGERLHLMHWVPAVSATLTVLLTFAVGRRVFGQRAALLALPLLAVSPFFILSSATLLAHSTAGLLLMAFVYAALRVLEHPERGVWWLAAAVVLSGAGLTRPLSAAAFAVPWLIVLATTLRRARARVWSGAALFCLVGAASVGLLAAYHVALSGDPLTTGYHTFSQINRFTFTLGALVAPAPYPSLFELGYTLARLNFWLFGWPVSLAFLPFFRRSREGVALLLAPAAVVLLFALTTVPSINVVGPVHYAELIAPLVLVSASGIEELALWVRTRLNVSAGRVLALPIAATLCALVLYVPLYVGSLSAMASIARAPYDLVEAARLDHAVVFVRSLGALDFPPWSWAYYPRNPSPALADRVLYVRDLGEERNRELIRFLPDRAPFWMGVRGGQLVLVPLAR
ncbi:MAG TPA: glycosyltransferase family 39 protein [Candidatus Deferrimicrobiaceae bacterium]|nr:glycosyltransferase family 39 protein [Candidatus Deferrimicrobiaceae bacterium]